MAYIANTAFEVRVSNHEFDSVANITGKYQNSTPADEICSAGFLCKRVSLIDNEGYSGIKNGNTWIMQAGEATDKEDVYLFHGDCLADAEKCAAIMKEKYGIKNVHLGYIGCVVGSHVGPGALVLGYLGEKR